MEYELLYIYFLKYILYLQLGSVPSIIMHCRGRSGLPWWLSGKESACNAGDTGDTGLILGLGSSPEEGMATHSSILAWRIPWTEKPGGLQPIESQRIRHNKRLSMQE